jgi:hypothetical protein
MALSLRYTNAQADERLFGDYGAQRGIHSTLAGADLQSSRAVERSA